MALFRRRSKRTEEGSARAPEAFASDREERPELPRRGPRDSGGEPVPAGYVDLGAVYVPRLPGLQLRGKFEADKTTLFRMLLVLGTSGVTVSVAAAPKSGGAWTELSEQIETSIVGAGGSVERAEGPYGTELHARVAAVLPDGTRGFSPLRIIGVEGPRWVARLDIAGAAAAGDNAQTEACEALIDQLIVNRGDSPRIRFEVLPLSLPRDAAALDEPR
ncbi:DUF3710 domain-containing protein [Actinomyces minihominis]|uniref:DUF3710 domain-containing protein n=1 Tax=Actinomyces minihominis TaxID=2002838 RepID=UPI000C06F467|nr:DUF3710 domain-containing protein [Actinomyces minihominis]